MSETKENCPDCGHFRPHHFKSYYAYDRGCFWDDCPCTRTYESLVGEKGDGLNCPCQKWAGRADWIDGHHPNCDGHGKPKTHFVTGLSVAEPSLSLLVVDYGHLCTVYVEKCSPDWTIPNCGNERLFQSDAKVLLATFIELKDSIDGVKPLPRIERGNNGSYRLFDCNDKFGHELCEDAFRVYQETVGKPLPIYEAGKWEDLLPLPNMGIGWELPIGVWRYRRA